MRRPPTDREILQKIHDKYLDDFGNFKEGESKQQRHTKIYVPIDCKVIADEMNVDPDIVFGRLYYHLDKKYGYTQDNGAKVHLFTLRAGDDRNAVNFPMLSAVLAELRQSWFEFTVPLIFSAAAVGIALIGLSCGSS